MIDDLSDLLYSLLKLFIFLQFPSVLQYFDRTLVARNLKREMVMTSLFY